MDQLCDALRPWVKVPFFISYGSDRKSMKARDKEKLKEYLPHFKKVQAVDRTWNFSHSTITAALQQIDEKLTVSPTWAGAYALKLSAAFRHDMWNSTREKKKKKKKKEGEEDADVSASKEEQDTQQTQMTEETIESQLGDAEEGEDNEENEEYEGNEENEEEEEMEHDECTEPDDEACLKRPAAAALEKPDAKKTKVANETPPTTTTTTTVMATAAPTRRHFSKEAAAPTTKSHVFQETAAPATKTAAAKQTEAFASSEVPMGAMESITAFAEQEGLLLPYEPEMTPEPLKAKSPDDLETEPGGEVADVATLPEPPALEDVSASVMRDQYQLKGIATLELNGKPEYEYGFDKSHGRAWRMRILGGKKRGPTEWSNPPSLDDRGPHAAVRCFFADGDIFESGLVTQEDVQHRMTKHKSDGKQPKDDLQASKKAKPSDQDVGSNPNKKGTAVASKVAEGASDLKKKDTTGTLKKKDGASDKKNDTTGASKQKDGGLDQKNDTAGASNQKDGGSGQKNDTDGGSDQKDDTARAGASMQDGGSEQMKDTAGAMASTQEEAGRDQEYRAALSQAGAPSVPVGGAGGASLNGVVPGRFAGGEASPGTLESGEAVVSGGEGVLPTSHPFHSDRIKSEVQLQRSRPSTLDADAKRLGVDTDSPALGEAGVGAEPDYSAAFASSTAPGPRVARVEAAPFGSGSGPEGTLHRVVNEAPTTSARPIDHKENVGTTEPSGIATEGLDPIEDEAPELLPDVDRTTRLEQMILQLVDENRSLKRRMEQAEWRSQGSWHSGTPGEAAMTSPVSFTVEGGVAESSFPAYELNRASFDQSCFGAMDQVKLAWELVRPECRKDGSVKAGQVFDIHQQAICFSGNRWHDLGGWDVELPCWIVGEADWDLWVQWHQSEICLRRFMLEELCDEGSSSDLLVQGAERLYYQERLCDWLENARRELGCWKESAQEEVDQWVRDGIAVIQLPGKCVLTRKSGTGLAREDLYASGAEGVTLRTALAYAARFVDWRGLTIDVKSAFLYAPIGAEAKGREERIVVKPPSFLTELGILKSTDRWWVKKALYGLPTSPKDWGNYRDQEFRSLRLSWEGGSCGLVQSKADESLWFIRMLADDEYGEVVGLLVVYVDDLAVFSKVAICEAFIQAVQEKWKTSPPTWFGEEPITFCGVEIVLTGRGYRLAQTSYLKELLIRYGVEGTATVPVTKWTEPELPAHVELEDVRAAQGITGALLWIATRSRPDVSFAVSKMGQMATKAPKVSIELGMQVLAYLSSTSLLGIEYLFDAGSYFSDHGGLSVPRTDHVLEIYSDASHSPAGDRSTQCVIIMWRGSPLVWESTRQPFTTLSSAEAELVSMVHSVTLTESLQPLVDEMVGGDTSMALLGDNAAAIRSFDLAGNGWRNRHLRMRAISCRERVLAGLLRVSHLPGSYQVADIGTKALSRVRLMQLLELLNIRGPLDVREIVSTARMLSRLSLTGIASVPLTAEALAGLGVQGPGEQIASPEENCEGDSDRGSEQKNDTAGAMASTQDGGSDQKNDNTDRGSEQKNDTAGAMAPTQDGGSDQKDDTARAGASMQGCGAEQKKDTAGAMAPTQESDSEQKKDLAGAMASTQASGDSQQKTDPAGDEKEPVAEPPIQEPVAEPPPLDAEERAMLEEYTSEKGAVKVMVRYKKQKDRNDIVILSLQVEGKWRQKAQIVVKWGPRGGGMPPWAAMLGMKQVAEQILSSGNIDNIKQWKEDVVRAINASTWVEYMENLRPQCEK
ncbi:RE2 [Symbiodinium sp. CCMP2592]|nr:RE2 [Symbiodinium sp. CCMP2592]